MIVHVELFGIARARAGIERTTAQGSCLGEVLVDLARNFPPLGQACIEHGKLRPGYTANLRGERFITDPATPLREGDSVLILTLDAGG